MGRVLIFGILIGFLPLQSFSQDCDTSVFFMDAIKNTFYYKDTVIVSIGDQRMNELIGQGLGFLETTRCFNDGLFREYFKIVKGEQLEERRSLSDSVIAILVQQEWEYHKPSARCYSYYKSPGGWYTLTFLSSGVYAPYFTLLNYTPQGQFNRYILVQSRFTGDDCVKSSIWAGDTIVTSCILRIDSPEKPEFLDSVITRHFMKESGELVYVDDRTIRVKNKN